MLAIARAATLLTKFAFRLEPKDYIRCSVGDRTDGFLKATYFPAMTSPDSRKTGIGPHGPEMTHDRKDHADHELDADALTALEQARKLKPGPERAEAMKRAGILRRAADLRGLFFPKRGRPRKT